MRSMDKFHEVLDSFDSLYNIWFWFRFCADFCFLGNAQSFIRFMGISVVEPLLFLLSTIQHSSNKSAQSSLRNDHFLHLAPWFEWS